MGREVQRRHVLQDEVAAAVIVDALDGVEDAVCVVCDGFVCDLGICDEGVVAEIVGSDEDAVYGLVRWVDHEFRPVAVDVAGVGDVCRDFVSFYVWEVEGVARNLAWGDVVTADSAGYGVVVDIGARVLGNILRPRPSAIGGHVVLRNGQQESIAI